MIQARNPYRILDDGKTVEMELTQGKVCLFDLESLPVVAIHRWYALHKGKGRFYVVGHGGLKMHRVIMGATDPAVEVDHVNGDGLDNRTANMRTCTHSENMKNQRRRSAGASGLKGVTYDPSRRLPYRASIRIDKKLVNVASFSHPVLAAAAYDRAAILAFGEFANTNFPILKEGDNASD